MEDFHGQNAAEGAAKMVRGMVIKFIIAVAVIIGLMVGCSAWVFG